MSDDLSGLEPQVTLLSLDDFNRLMDAVENPPPPTPELVALMRMHEHVSTRVFDGVRVLTGDAARANRERAMRALARLSQEMDPS